MSKKRSSPPYTGILQRPIERRGWKAKGLLSRFQDTPIYEEQLHERLIALFQHYKINDSGEGAIEELALRLAQEHVPGFQVRQAETKQITWTRDRLYALRAAVLKIRVFSDNGSRRATPLSVSVACMHLAKKKLSSLKGLSAPRIRRLYNEAASHKRNALKYRLRRWDVVFGSSLSETRRRAKLSHPWWQTRLKNKDPEALRQFQLQTESKNTLLALALASPDFEKS